MDKTPVELDPKDEFTLAKGADVWIRVGNVAVWLRHLPHGVDVTLHRYGDVSSAWLDAAFAPFDRPGVTVSVDEESRQLPP